MKKILYLLILLTPALHAADSLHIPTEPHSEPLSYEKHKPLKNSPSEACLNLLLLSESGKMEEAEKFISKTTPGWLKESFLRQESKEHGPIRMETLNYQLTKIEGDKYYVRFSLNWKNGTYTSGVYTVISEDGKWVVR